MSAEALEAVKVAIYQEQGPSFGQGTVNVIETYTPQVI